MPAQPAAVTPEQKPGAETPVQQERATKRLCALRVRWGVVTSQLVAGAAAHMGPTLVARLLKVDRKRVNDWFDPSVDAAMSLRDILAVGGDFARTVLKESLALLDEAQPLTHLAPERHALRLLTAAGLVSQRLEVAMVDAHLDTKERVELDQVLAQLEERVAQFRRDLRSKQG